MNKAYWKVKGTNTKEDRDFKELQTYKVEIVVLRETKGRIKKQINIFTF